MKWSPFFGPPAKRAVWVEVDLGVGLRAVRSPNLRMYRLEAWVLVGVPAPEMGADRAVGMLET